MLTRLLILLVIAAAVVLVWLLLRLRRQHQLRALGSFKPFAELVPVGGPAVIAFTLPGCSECRTRQAPALERLRTRLGPAVPVLTLPADAHPDLVERLGIMTVPATVVLDAAGGVRYLNQGFAGDTLLAEQVRAHEG